MTFRKACGSAALLFLVLAALSLGGCSNCTPEHPCCRAGEVCSCDPGVEQCTIDCALSGTCKPSCDDSFQSCDIDCGAATCDAKCNGGDDCNTTCADDCKTSCTSASGCKAECGARCDYECRSVSSCEVKAGPDSVIHCESVGSCHGVCTGNCRLDCPQAGSCSLECSDGQAGQTIPGESCGATSFACGGC